MQQHKIEHLTIAFGLVINRPAAGNRLRGLICWLTLTRLGRVDAGAIKTAGRTHNGQQEDELSYQILEHYTYANGAFELGIIAKALEAGGGGYFTEYRVFSGPVIRATNANFTRHPIRAVAEIGARDINPAFA